MATLRSEDAEFESSITIAPGKMLEIDALSSVSKEREVQLWQLVNLTLASGQRTLSFSTEGGQGEGLSADQSQNQNQSEDYQQKSLTAAIQTISAVAHAYLVCRKPSDEPHNLVKMLGELIAGTRSKLLFEPAEPCFELSINSVGGGLRVELFVDAGNVETGIYRWDALGVRFFTTSQKLQTFLDELKADFNC